MRFFLFSVFERFGKSRQQFLMPNDLASKRLLIYAESVGRISRCPFVVRYKHPVHSVSPFVSRLYIYAGVYNWFVIGQGLAD